MKLRASFSLLALAAATTAVAQTTTPPAATTAHHRTTAASTTPTTPKGIPPAHGVVHTAYSLKYIDTKIGTGEPAANNKFYTVQYTGWLAADGKKFDSSFDHGAAFSPPFPIGAHRVIPGWDTGFAGMRVGGKRRLFIPYQLGYGDMGHPPIPPKADLIFDIELIAISDKPLTQRPPARPAPPTAPPAPGAPAAPATPPAAGAPPAPSAAPATPPAPSTATPPPAATAPPAPAAPATPPPQPQN